MEKNAKIFVAGHRGLVGSAIVRALLKDGYKNLILKTHSELDLLNIEKVKNFFNIEKPDYVFLSAAKVGGIYANNTFPADFIYENLTIQNNVIHESYLSGVKKLLFLGSSCIYPRDCAQPIKEEYLLSGKLELTNEPYAIAKIAGIKMCQSYNRQYKSNFICAMPTNLYGINDNFSLENSHVIPAIIKKAHQAKINNSQEVIIWGTGKPKREFLFADDLGEACVFLMNNYNDNEIINVGVGEDLTIRELSEEICNVIGFSGKLVFDTTKPDGTPRKLLNVDKIKSLGWHAKTNLKDGLKLTYEWFLKNFNEELQ